MGTPSQRGCAAVLVVSKDAINSASQNLVMSLQDSTNHVGKRVILPTIEPATIRTAVLTAFAILAQQPVIGEDDRVRRELGETLCFVDEPPR